jgi:uncharacterized protein
MSSKESKLKSQTDYNRLADNIRSHHKVQEMKDYVQHGDVSVYDHVNTVAHSAYRLAHLLKLKVDDKVLVEGALLHDFFGYDWHDNKVKRRLFEKHGFTHAGRARERAVKHFDIGPETQHVIESHMWPLNLGSMPRTREAILVCVVDKVVSAKETLNINGRSNRIKHRRRYRDNDQKKGRV